MLNIRMTSDRATLPQLRGTLWRCEVCNSFVSIHSVHAVLEAPCPICGNVPLELCGTFDSILGLQFADA